MGLIQFVEHNAMVLNPGVGLQAAGDFASANSNGGRRALASQQIPKSE
jgi:hypothetical protein